MEDLELVRSSQKECEYIHQRLQEYNRPYMDESMDFSFHIEDGGRIVAGNTTGHIWMRAWTSRSISRMVDGSLQE